MMSLGLSSTFDVIAFDQNWRHLCSTFAEGKDLSNDTQIRVIGSMEPGICTKILRNLSDNSRQHFLPLHMATPWQKLPVSMVLNFLKVFKLEASSVESQSLQQKDKKQAKIL